MLKKKIIILGLLSSMLLLSSCGEAKTTTNNNQTKQNEQGQEQKGNPNGRNGMSRMMRADLSGVLKKFSDAEITIDLYEEMPQRSIDPNRTMNPERSFDPNRTRDPNRTFDPNRTRDPNASPGQNNQDGNFNRNGQNGFRGGMGNRKTTGKLETLNISNVKIKYISFGNGQMREDEIKANELKEGDIIQVYYKKDTDKQIDYIGVLDTEGFQGGQGKQEPKTQENVKQ